MTTQTHTCAVCSQQTARLVSKPFQALYNKIPVSLDSVERYECSNCGEETLTPDQHRALSQAVKAGARQHLGLLSPEDILEIRNNLNVSQTELEDLMGLTRKTVSRWETDRVLQSRTADILLRLLSQDPALPARLRAISGQGPKPQPDQQADLPPESTRELPESPTPHQGEEQSSHPDDPAEEQPPTGAPHQGEEQSNHPDDPAEEQPPTGAPQPDTPQVQQPTVHLTLTQSVEYHRRQHRWAATTREFGFTTYGVTREEAEANLHQALTALARSFPDSDSFRQYLTERAIPHHMSQTTQDAPAGSTHSLPWHPQPGA